MVTKEWNYLGGYTPPFGQPWPFQRTLIHSENCITLKPRPKALRRAERSPRSLKSSTSTRIWSFGRPLCEASGNLRFTLRGFRRFTRFERRPQRGFGTSDAYFARLPRIYELRASTSTRIRHFGRLLCEAPVNLLAPSVDLNEDSAPLTRTLRGFRKLKISERRPQRGFGTSDAYFERLLRIYELRTSTSTRIRHLGRLLCAASANLRAPSVDLNGDSAPRAPTLRSFREVASSSHRPQQGLGTLGAYFRNIATPAKDLLS